MSARFPKPKKGGKPKLPAKKRRARGYVVRPTPLEWMEIDAATKRFDKPRAVWSLEAVLEKARAARR